MGTTQNNPDFARPAGYNGNLAKQVAVSSDQTINLGDLVYWDPVNFTAKALSAASQVASQFLGAAEGSTPGLIYGLNDPGSDPVQPSIPVMCRGAAYVNATAGETYSHFLAVTVGADAQTVTAVGATSSNRVGFVLLDPPALGSARGAPGATPLGETVKAVAGTRLVIQIEAKHPVAIAL